MNKYSKIPTVYKRDPENNYKTLLEGQYATPEIEYLKDNIWEFTEKIDGTNVRVMWDLIELKYGGRTDNSQMPTFLYSKLQELFQLGRFQSLYPDTPMCLYGEGYGAKIQKGGGNYIPDGVSFILFDVKIGESWLERIDVEDIAEKLLIKPVPIVGYGILDLAVNIARQKEKSWLSDNKIAEGLVMRPCTELLDRRGHRIIAKIKGKDFPE